MQSPEGTNIETINKRLSESLEFFDATPSKSSLLNRHTLESPGARCRETSSDEFEKMVTFENIVNPVRLYSSSQSISTIRQHDISNPKLEKIMNYIVMFVVVLDTSLVVFEFGNKDESHSLWIIWLTWVFLFVYSVEVAIRLHIVTPTFAFFRKRFYVLDLMILVACLALQIASSMSVLGKSTRAIRLVRIIRLSKLCKFLRVFTRGLEILHGYNKRKVKVRKGTSLHIYLRINADRYKLQEFLARKKVDGSVTLLKKGMKDHSEDQRALDIYALYKVVKMMKDEDDKHGFNFSEFFMEWLMLLSLWLGVVLVLSWQFILLEFENYQMEIEENRLLKSLVVNSLPVRDQLPDVLTSLAKCSGNTSKHSYILLNKVYSEYTSKNKTLWDDLDRFMGSYTFTNPWTFPGACFFTISVVTTIGWGSFTPSTTGGQLAVVLSSLPAILITVVFGRKNIQMFKAGVCKTQYESILMIVLFSVLLTVSYLVGSGYILSHQESWTLWESIYFCWVSSSTIGFGDFTPTVGEEFNITYLALVIVGWHIVSFVISVMEITLSAMKQMNWWSEHHLFPPGANRQEPKKSAGVKNNPEKFYGVAKVVKEMVGLPKMTSDSLLLLTPLRPETK